MEVGEVNKEAHVPQNPQKTYYEPYRTENTNFPQIPHDFPQMFEFEGRILKCSKKIFKIKKHLRFFFSERVNLYPNRFWQLEVHHKC